MNLLSALKALQNVNIPVMGTIDIANTLGINNAHASQVLKRLADKKHIIHLSRGLWVIDLKINPLLITQYLLAPFPAYISLQTALYHHGMIDQVPRVISVASLARTRSIKTPFATISVHHISPNFFFDYEVDPKTGVKMATPEKALLDFFYLKPAKSLWFKTLPELELPKSFNFKRALEMIQKIPSKSRRAIVENSLRAIAP
jgi:predicted transcriptional regulator of viral defense system